MAGTRPELNVIAGDARTEKIALSFVHSSGRIDVPVGTILWIEAREDFRYLVKGQMRSVPSPHVEVNLRFDVRARLYKLTRTIVGQPLEILVGEQSVSSPIVRQPIGGRAPLHISASDFDEACSLAARLRERCGIAGPRLVS
jgi:preprotein translocase subunit SecD